MANIILGDDALLTTALTAKDRITLTREATGQQIATMTVANFMQRCAQMLPVATLGNNGLMTPEDRAFLPPGLNVRHYREDLWLNAGETVKFKFANAVTNAIIAVASEIYYFDGTGMIIKSMSAHHMNSFYSSTLACACSHEFPDYAYLSGLMPHNYGYDELMAFFTHHYGQQAFRFYITLFEGDYLGYEIAGNEGLYWGQNNRDEWHNHQNDQ